MSDQEDLKLARAYCRQAKYILDEFFASENQKSGKTKKNKNAELADIVGQVTELYFQALNSFSKLSEPYLGLAGIFIFCKKKDLAVHILKLGTINIPENNRIKKLHEVLTQSRQELKADIAPNMFNFKPKKI